jgi:hypothetical protein
MRLPTAPNWAAAPVEIEMPPTRCSPSATELLAATPARSRFTGDPDLLKQAAAARRSEVTRIFGRRQPAPDASPELLALAEMLRRRLSSRNGKGTISDRHYLAHG